LEIDATIFLLTYLTILVTFFIPLPIQEYFFQSIDVLEIICPYQNFAGHRDPGSHREIRVQKAKEKSCG